jgi:hypothetical protein
MHYCLKSRVMSNISHMLLCLYFKVYLPETIANLIIMPMCLCLSNIQIGLTIENPCLLEKQKYDQT